MKCEFEEKQYEQPLNNELAGRKPMYIPGQVFENTVAIDAALFSKNPKFWKLWNDGTEMKWKSGVHLKPELWDIVEEAWEIDEFPKFKCNLFVQHKCPQYITSRRGNEYSLWGKPYFRYYLTDHQQKTLYKLEQRASANALVVYACASFWRRRDLWRFIKGKLVENSNFVQPYRVQGHKGYTFVQGGKDGYGCSEPARIEGIDILGEIDNMIEKPLEFESNVKFVHILAREIKTAIEELDEITRAEFFEIERAIGVPEHALGSSVMTVFIFNLLTNTTWGIGYKVKR